MRFTDELRARPPIISDDHPLSLGWTLHVVSTSRKFDSIVHVSTDSMDYVRDGGKWEACHGEWHSRKSAVIAIEGRTTNGCEQPLTRIIELIVHEVSHFVDATFKRASLTTVDTELRAYYNDWIVGKIVAHLLFE
jgi:hypothetical protein